MDITQYLVMPTTKWLAMFIAVLLLTSPRAHSTAHGGLKLNIELTFGSHNTTASIGFLAFGTTAQSNLAAELGAAVWAQTHLKRFGAGTTGWSIGYDVPNIST